MEPIVRSEEMGAGARTQSSIGAIETGPSVDAGMATEVGHACTSQSSETSVSVAGPGVPYTVQYGQSDNGGESKPQAEERERNEAERESESSALVGSEVFSGQFDPARMLPSAEEIAGQENETQSEPEEKATEKTTTEKENFVYNITTGKMTAVPWDCKPLLETEHGRILQIHLWSPIWNQWVKLVAEKFEEVGSKVVTPDELFQIHR